MRKLVLYSVGDVGATMSGPGIRYYHFAAELADEFEITLMTPDGADPGLAGVRVVASETNGVELARTLARHDVVVAQKLPPATMRRLAHSDVRVIYDLYVPQLSEQLGMLDVALEHPQSERFHQAAMLEQRLALTTGNAFVCASERQRDFWLGLLGALGRLDLETYRADPTLRDLVDVVPFGLPAEPPAGGEPVLKGVVPGIGEDDRILLWGGGVWNWFDPLTVIRAVELLARRRDDVKLVFLGLRHRQVGEMAMTERALELARSLGLLGGTVFVNEGWVPYRKRHQYLSEADLGVSAHFDSLEARYAFRTRLLDYLWAGLPTVTTRGDVLSELIAERNLGRAVVAEDPERFASAVEELLDDTEEYERVRRNVEEAREVFAWPRVVEPLARLARIPGTPVVARRATAAFALESARLRLRTAYEIRGVRGLVSAKAARLARFARR